MTSKPTIHGHVDPGFEPVADAFAGTFRRAGELGACLAVHYRGRMVVDLWAGTRDAKSGAPWEEDTVVPVFSTGKGVGAIVLARMVSNGVFSYADPVVAHWPDFGRAEKAAISMADLLAHKAGLVLFGQAVTRRHLGDREEMTRIIEAMQPVWPPGQAWGYHIGTFGPIVNEFVRRADPAGRSLGAVLREEIAEPLGLDISFGLPASMPDEKRARVSLPTPWMIAGDIVHAPFPLVRQTLNPLSLLNRALLEIRDFSANDPGWMKHEFPSGNGLATARSLARLYGLLAEGGAALGITPSVATALTGPPSLPPEGARDRVMGVQNRFHLGFVRPSDAFRFSPSARALGMPGLGGSFAFADPDRRLGYAYAPNRLGLLPFDDPREQAVRTALYRVLDGLAEDGGRDAASQPTFSGEHPG